MKENIMGFLSNLFSSDATQERTLIDNYTKFWETQGLSRTPANEKAKELLKEAKKMMDEDLKGRTEPANFGNWLLKQESNDEKILDNLNKKRAEGVKDNDIRWWWNMPPLERYMMLASDNRAKATMAYLYCKEGKSTELACKLVWKHHACYGEPGIPHPTQSGEDAPLPYELKDRINIYLINRSKIDPDSFMQDRENSSSFNSLIRKEIKAGRI
jgi:hypothetical protein